MKMKNSDLSSWLLLIALLSNSLTTVFSSVIGIKGVYVITCLSIAIGVFLVKILFDKMQKSKKSYLIVVFYSLAMFLISLLLNGINTFFITSFQKFLLNGILIGGIILLNFNFVLVLKKSIILVFFINLWTLTNQKIIEQFDLGQKMGFGYSILPILFLSYYAVKLTDSRSRKMIAIVNLISSFWLIFIYSSRGTILCILVFILFEVIYKVKNKRMAEKVRIFSIFLLFSILLISSLLFFAPVILEKSQSLNFYRSPIVRILVGYENDFEGFDTGRSEIYENFKKDMNSRAILFGNGIAKFDLKYNTYTHNIVTHLIYEIGVVMSFFYFTLIVNIIWYLIKNKDELLLVFFACSIPRLMVSSYLWQDQFFWMFLYFGLIKLNKKNIKRYNNESFNR